jgi:hypothetical protein
VLELRVCLEFLDYLRPADLVCKAVLLAAPLLLRTDFLGLFLALLTLILEATLLPLPSPFFLRTLIEATLFVPRSLRLSWFEPYLLEKLDSEYESSLGISKWVSLVLTSPSKFKLSSILLMQSIRP